MQENEKILTIEGVFEDEAAVAEGTVTPEISEEVPKPKRTRRKKTEELAPEESPTAERRSRKLQYQRKWRMTILRI